MPDEKNNTVRFPSYVLLPLVAAVIILCVKIIYYPHASGYAAYGFTSITLILFIVPIILIVNFFYTRFTKMNKPPSRSPALSWINRRRSFRIHYPYGQRPKLIIDRTDNIDRRGLEFLILDLSQNGLRLADDGCLGPIEFLSGKLQLPLLPDIHISGTLVRQNGDEISLNFNHPLPWRILLSEQRRILQILSG